ncbi:MAG: complex I NDUFA9 subunit family protein [Candidatus Latescibacterota bacterium]|nr:MAG: complex I NDUFA9 subunit family protein [Candidatus Latescibacterota bacterium]
MRVLLTGGTGYVGSRLREVLRSEGHQVRLLVRKESAKKVRALESAGSHEIAYGSIFETNTCLHACDGCDAVVHLVGIIREVPSKGITFEELHRVATSNIVDAARRMGVERFVHMSALGASDDASSRYHRTKRAAEKIVEESALRWTIFRPSWVFSPGDELSRTIADLIRKPVVPLVSGGQSRLQPVALDDVCTCMARSLGLPETQGRIYELGGPDRVTFKDIVEQAASTLGGKLKTMTVPAWSVRPFVWVLQRFESFPLTLDQLQMLSEDNVCEIDPYVKTFQIEPKSFCSSIPALFG